MVVFPSAVDQKEMVTGGVAWSDVEGESTYDVTWPSLHGNINNCGMAFKDDLMSNVAIDKDNIPMQLCRGVKHVRKPN